MYSLTHPTFALKSAIAMAGKDPVKAQAVVSSTFFCMARNLLGLRLVKLTQREVQHPCQYTKACNIIELTDSRWKNATQGRTRRVH
jgi:hypothetical protein